MTFIRTFLSPSPVTKVYIILFIWYFGVGCALAQAQTFAGSWKGYLSQADRPYGFHFSVELEPGGGGFSKIVSEGSGGEATMALKWSYDTLTKKVLLKETEVVERSVSSWKWCLKTAGLTLRQESAGYILEGTWTGQIEGRPDKAGACAPGTIYLQKIELPKVAVSETKPSEPKDSTVLGRILDIQHIIEVARPDIRVRIWDNGIPDGDIVTVLLDDRKLVQNLRVTKRPYTFPVVLTEALHVLVLHAESLGSLPPNTVAVSIFDGVREHVIVVRADIQESGGILIRQFSQKKN